MGFLSELMEKARKKNSKKSIRIAFPESLEKRTLKAVSEIVAKRIAIPVLVGNRARIEKELKRLKIKQKGIEIIDVSSKDYSQQLYDLRKHKQITLEQAKELLKEEIYFATMMLYNGKVDGVISGAIHATAHTLKPAFQIIKARKGLASGFFLMHTCLGTFVFADCGVNPNPDAEQLANIALQSAESFKDLAGKEPRVAMLSFSTKGSAKSESTEKVIKATEIAKKANPKLVIDGELQLDAAIVKEVAKLKAPKSVIKGDANVLIFPNLDAGNICYKAVERFGNAVALGPIVQGLKKPVNDLSRGCSSNDIVLVAAITVLQAEK